MTPEEEAKYEELSRKAEAGELTAIPGTEKYGEEAAELGRSILQNYMIPGSSEDLIDDVMEEVRYYAHDYNTFHPVTSFRDVEETLQKALAKVWQDAYTQGITDQITSESTPEYAPNRPNPYKKDTNEH